MYDRQFIIGPEEKIKELDWNITKFHNNLILQTHPLLEVSETVFNGKRLLLLGFILNPLYPKHNNEDILNYLIKNINDISDLIELVDRLSGRFILIAFIENEIYFLPDATCLRSFFYYFDRNSDFFCASQAKLIANNNKIKKNEFVHEEFLKSDYFFNTKEYWLPSGVTLYNDIYHLIPNHYLDFRGRKQVRCWPRKKRITNKPEHIIEEVLGILKNTLLAANYRYKMVVPLTGGFDSRIVLGITHSISPYYKYYTCLYGNLDSNSPDLVTAAQIAKDFNLHYSQINCTTKMDAGFAEYYKHNVELSREYYGDVGFNLKSFFDNQVVDVRAVTEIARCFFFRKKRDSGFDLAKIVGMESSKLAIKIFDYWLQESKEVINENGYEILDLFYWEQRLGSWRSSAALEWDGLRELLDPFNCKYLVELLLSVDEKYRIGEKKLFKMIVNEINPLLAKYEYTSESKGIIRKEKLVSVLSNLGIFEITHKVYRYWFKSIL